VRVVQTVVYRLEFKKAVRRTEKIGNAHVFEALVSRSSAQHRMIDELVALFGGKSLPIVAHVIDSGKLTPEEVREARKALRNATRKDKEPMIPSQLVPSANQLWQSTLFAGVAGLLTLFPRKNRAYVRYGLWLLASVKFLLPFSLLVAVGGLLGPHTTAAAAPSGLVSAAGFSSFVEQVGELFTPTLPQFAMPAVQRSYTSVIVVVLIFVWVAGFASLVCRWTLRCRRIHASVRKASPLHLPIGLPVKSSPAFGEPGVFGIFRPVLQLPDKILDCLTAREMESIVAHDLCHVRRRDNLATVIHTAVEVVFWFHPLVWWLGVRLMEERERAGDEEVLRNGGEPRAYAEGILKICELYLASPLACLAGVTGGDLKRRIEAITSNRVGTQTELRKEGDPGGCRDSGCCDSYHRWHRQYACGPGSILPSCSIRCHAEIRSGLHQDM
jgi:beta-lactamase regulating signal transducer with metallopeptidase domain